MLKKLHRSSVALAVAAMSFVPLLAQAQAKCTVNGQEVPCGEATGFVGFAFGMMAVMAVVSLAATVFWILMIVHAAKHDIENKALWLIIMVFTGAIGSIIYYFAVKRGFEEKPASSSMMPPAAPSAPVPPAPPAPPAPPTPPVPPPAPMA